MVLQYPVPMFDPKLLPQFDPELVKTVDPPDEPLGLRPVLGPGQEQAGRERVELLQQQRARGAVAGEILRLG